MPTLGVTVAVGAALLVGCSGGSGSPAASAGPTLPPPAAMVPLPSVPDSVPPGTAVFAIGDERVALQIQSCSFDPGTVASVLSVDLAVNASAPDGSTLTVTSVRASDVAGGSGVSSTQSVTFKRGTEADEAQRVATSGDYRDPANPSVSGPLLTVDGSTVRAGGIFSTSGTAPGTPSQRPASFVATCAPS